MPAQRAGMPLSHRVLLNGVQVQFYHALLHCVRCKVARNRDVIVIPFFAKTSATFPENMNMILSRIVT